MFMFKELAFAEVSSAGVEGGFLIILSLYF